MNWNLKIAFLLILISNNILGQKAIEKENGTITNLNGSIEKVKVFDENNPAFLDRVFILNSENEKIEYSPKDIEGFSFIDKNERVFPYDSKLINKEYHFLPKVTSGVFTLYSYTHKKGKLKYYGELIIDQDSSIMIYIRDYATLNLFTQKQGLTIKEKQKLKKEEILKTFKKMNMSVGQDYKEFKRKPSLLLGVQYFNYESKNYFELNFTIRRNNNFKFIEYQTKLSYYEDNRYALFSGFNFKILRKRFQPYVFLGVGLNRMIQDSNFKRTRVSFEPRVGLGFYIIARNYLKIELMFTSDAIASIGYSFKIK